MRQPLKRKKGTKYHNTKVEIDGRVFDSKREGDAYMLLKDYERIGLISDLVCQPKYELIPAIKETYTKHLKTKEKLCERTVQLPINYIADFRFTLRGQVIVVDVKISKFLLPKEYVLKTKMMRYFHHIAVTEVYKTSDLVALVEGRTPTLFDDTEDIA
jgi:hypothetical protein